MLDFSAAGLRGREDARSAPAVLADGETQEVLQLMQIRAWQGCLQRT